MKNDYFKVPQAVITHADLTTAVATDQAESTEVIYWVKNIDLQFLVVKLPAKAKLVSDVFVGKEAQQPMRREGSDDLLVRLPTGGSTHRESFAVRFVYQMESPASGQGLGTWGSLHVETPTVAEKIFETRHRLYLPDGQDYTHFDGPLAQDYTARGWPQIIHTFERALWWLPVDAIASLVFRGTDQLNSSQWSDPPQIPAEIRNTFDFQVPPARPPGNPPSPRLPSKHSRPLPQPRPHLLLGSARLCPSRRRRRLGHPMGSQKEAHLPRRRHPCRRAHHRPTQPLQCRPRHRFGPRIGPRHAPLASHRPEEPPRRPQAQTQPKTKTPALLKRQRKW